MRCITSRQRQRQFYFDAIARVAEPRDSCLAGAKIISAGTGAVIAIVIARAYLRYMKSYVSNVPIKQLY